LKKWCNDSGVPFKTKKAAKASDDYQRQVILDFKEEARLIGGKLSLLTFSRRALIPYSTLQQWYSKFERSLSADGLPLSLSSCTIIFPLPSLIPCCETHIIVKFARSELLMKGFAGEGFC
jgi:hypothetical protein